MKQIDANSIGSVVSDIPYGWGFMGANWDKFTSKGYQQFCFEWGSKALRILKPGGYCLSFSAPRKYHRMACGLEDAGFKIKDMIEYEFGCGIPKNLDISLSINKQLGGDIKRGNMLIAPDGQTYDKRMKIKKPLTDYCYGGDIIEEEDLYEKIPTNQIALKWKGYGTGLKPAHEPIMLAQKPYEGTYAKNIIKWGVGALNIDACRVNYIKEKETDNRIYNSEKNITRGKHENATIKYAPDGNEFPMYNSQEGRWPSNLIIDPISTMMLDEQSGILKTGEKKPYKQNFQNPSGIRFFESGTMYYNYYPADKGGASRFFYSAKAYKNERNAGCEDLYWEKIKDDFKKITKKQFEILPSKKRAKGNPISTLKPINLMRYLVRLVTPPNETILDPFAGSGTTGIACIIEGFNYILIEKRNCFAKIIIPKRLEFWKNPKNWNLLKDHSLLPNIQMKIKKEQNKSLDMWIK